MQIAFTGQKVDIFRAGVTGFSLLSSLHVHPFWQKKSKISIFLQFWYSTNELPKHNYEEEAFGAKNRFLTRAIQSFTITFALGSLPHWRTIIVSSYCEFCHRTRRSCLNDAFCNSTGCSTPFVGIRELLEKSIEKWKYWVDVRRPCSNFSMTTWQSME